MFMNVSCSRMYDVWYMLNLILYKFKCRFSVARARARDKRASV